MRLLDWRRNDELVAYSAKLLTDPQFRLLLDMLETEHPKNYHSEVEPAERSLGKIYGYDYFKNNLEASARLEKEPEPLQSTFEEETYGRRKTSRKRSGD